MKNPRIALIICMMLLTGFAVTSWRAIQTKSPTYDEPYHAIAGWVQSNRHDFRIDNEDPPLWLYWASLPNDDGALKADFIGPTWKSIPEQLVHQWYWSVVTLYRTPGNDPVAFINHCRLMMLLVAVALGGMIGYWSWKIGGPVAAVVATAFFCLDPNFLAHASLMKNDVVFAMSLLLLAWALWRAGQTLSLFNVSLVVLFCVFTLTVKFSGLIAVLLIPAMLGLRALLPEPWIVHKRVVRSRVARVAVVAGVIGLCAVVSYVGIWSVYGFRFRPTPETGVWLNLDELAERGNTNHLLAQNSERSSPEFPATLPVTPVVSSVLFANRHGLFPQAYLAGFLFTYDNAVLRPCYLCRELSLVGWWWYFPFAILVKTPVATLLAAMGAGLLAVRAVSAPHRREAAWTALCLAVPFAIFLASAMLSHLNIGIRHVLGLYPFAFIATGWAAGRIWSWRRGRLVVIGILLGLAVESIAAFPDFIPFFNIVATDTEGGINLLGDSNLDWGQDLVLLKAWQNQHPKEHLYLSYFGFADPKYFGIVYTPLPKGYDYDSKPAFPEPGYPCVLAISATNLQQIMIGDAPMRNFYEYWRRQKPTAVLGGSIYLFECEPQVRLRSP